jgi:uncharacterized protein
MRVVIDTNIWISYFLFNSFADFEKILSDRSLVIIACPELIDEIRKVLKYPKFKKVFTQKTINSILDLIIDRAVFIKPVRQKIKSRDAKDNYLIDLAVASKSKFLITGDKDLLELKKIDKTLVLTMKNFINRYKAF